MHKVYWLEWPAPKHVKACYTMRVGGVSKAPYDSFNLGDHVGDQGGDVANNRRVLADIIAPASITWLKQVHSTVLVNTSQVAADRLIEADACFSNTANQACCVMTADCLPIFICDQQGQQVAVAHAGWRGLLDGVLEQTLASFDGMGPLMAYLGPAISQSAFEVGSEVRDAFLQKSEAFAHHFVPSKNSLMEAESTQWMADLYGLAQSILVSSGVSSIYGGDRCTYTEPDTFFSYRRDGITGRMANLIWLE